MNRLYCQNIEPIKLTKEHESSIIKLHQTHFDLPDQDIVSLIKQRDRIRLYFEKQHNQLIGTVGVQTFYFGKGIALLYLGNIVIDEGYQQCGILSDSIIRESTRLILGNLLRKKYQMSLATTAKAYTYYQELPHAWPKPNKDTPKHVNEAFQSIVASLFENKFYVNDGNFIVVKLNSLHEKQAKKATNKTYCDHFEKLNPKHHEGHQLLCCAEFTFSNYFSLIKKFIMKRYKHLFSRIKQQKSC